VGDGSRIPSEADSGGDEESGSPVSYLVGTGKSKYQQYERSGSTLPWHKVRDSVEVKLFEQDGELYVLG